MIPFLIGFLSVPLVILGYVGKVVFSYKSPSVDAVFDLMGIA